MTTIKSVFNEILMKNRDVCQDGNDPSRRRDHIESARRLPEGDS